MKKRCNPKSCYTATRQRGCEEISERIALMDTSSGLDIIYHDSKDFFRFCPVLTAGETDTSDGGVRVVGVAFRGVSRGCAMPFVLLVGVER